MRVMLGWPQFYSICIDYRQFSIIQYICEKYSTEVRDSVSVLARDYCYRAYVWFVCYHHDNTLAWDASVNKVT